MRPLNIGEISTIFTKYTETWGVSIPDTIQLAIMRDSGGHAASLMALMKLYHERRPTTQVWEAVLQTDDYFIGVRKMIHKKIGSNEELCEHVRKLTVNAIYAGKTWELGPAPFRKLDKILLDIGIITPVGSGNLVRFTSSVISRACEEIVTPPFISVQALEEALEDVDGYIR